MKVFKYSLFSLISVFLIQCATPPEYPSIPYIEFVSLSKDTLIDGFGNEDQFILTFSFTDGDGDFGYAADDTIKNIFLVDTRTGLIAEKFTSPEIPELGSANGIRGEVILQVFNTCCILPDWPYVCNNGLPDGAPPTEELIYEIYVEDRAQNRSNTIMTPPITLICD